MTRIRLCLALALAAGFVPAARALTPEEAFQGEIAGVRAAVLPGIRAAKVAARKETSPAQARALVKAKLKGSVVPESYVDKVFDDPRTTIYPGIPGKFGGESAPPPYEEYRKGVITEKNIADGARFVRGHEALLDDVQARYAADGILLTALAAVETRYGVFVGTYPVFDAIDTIIQEVPSRSKWAVREEAELLKMTYAQDLDAHAMLGSYAGAFGFVQFEPSTYNSTAVAFDGKGRPRLDEWPDALASCANYLDRAGYDASAPFTPESPIGRSLYAYNHSENYVRVILELRGEILKRLAEESVQREPMGLSDLKKRTK